VIILLGLLDFLNTQGVRPFFLVSEAIAKIWWKFVALLVEINGKCFVVRTLEFFTNFTFIVVGVEGLRLDQI
jgi:hypothetical protein